MRTGEEGLLVVIVWAYVHNTEMCQRHWFLDLSRSKDHVVIHSGLPDAPYPWPVK